MAVQMFSRSLVEFIRQMHGVDVVWKPSYPGEEPPF